MKCPEGLISTRDISDKNSAYASKNEVLDWDGMFNCHAPAVFMQYEKGKESLATDAYQI